MFRKRTIRDIDLKGKTVLLRADYNVPLDKGAITSDYRIKQSLPTIAALLASERGVTRLIICSHLGRPEGADPALSLAPVAKRLGELSGRTVRLAPDCVGPAAAEAAAGLADGEILLLENLRFHDGEKNNDDDFARQLAALAGPDGVFVQDGFGVVHRAAASTVAITHQLPSAAGLLVAREVDTITNAMEQPERPLMTVAGGAKIEDKIDVLERFIQLADVVAVGGAMANTFLAAQGVDVAASLYDKDKLDEAKRILAAAEAEAAKRPFAFIVPRDGVAAAAADGSAPTRVVGFASHSLGNAADYAESPAVEPDALQPGEKILDIGPASAQLIAGIIKKMQTVIWNGPMGMDEVPAFAEGTKTIIAALPRKQDGRLPTIIGGGDTATMFEKLGLLQDYFVSTGGGASLDLMSGRPLPGVEALPDK